MGLFALVESMLLSRNRLLGNQGTVITSLLKAMPQIWGLNGFNSKCSWRYASLFLEKVIKICWILIAQAM